MNTIAPLMSVNASIISTESHWIFAVILNLKNSTASRTRESKLFCYILIINKQHQRRLDYTNKISAKAPMPESNTVTEYYIKTCTLYKKRDSSAIPFNETIFQIKHLLVRRPSNPRYFSVSRERNLVLFKNNHQNRSATTQRDARCGTPGAEEGWFVAIIFVPRERKQQSLGVLLGKREREREEGKGVTLWSFNTIVPYWFQARCNNRCENEEFVQASRQKKKKHWMEATNRRYIEDLHCCTI